MFNRDQREYMAYLAKCPPSTLCYCGWYVFGQCQNNPCQTNGKTAADKLAEPHCSECGNNLTPIQSGWAPIHLARCSQNSRKNL